MTDMLDEAQKLEEAERAAGVRALRDGLRRPGTRWCAGCGDEIPPPRRRAVPSATCCIDCQAKRETRHRAVRRPHAGRIIEMKR